MAIWKLEFLPHFMNAGAGNLTMRIDSAADIPVPWMPDNATEGSTPGTALVSSLQVGDNVTVAGFIHEIDSIDTDPDWE